MYSGTYRWGYGRLYFQAKSDAGLYWSSSVASYNNMYRLHVHGTRLISTTVDNKRDGFTLRCVMSSM